MSDPSGLASFLAERLDEAEQNISYAGPARIAWLTYLRDDGQLAYTTVAAGDDDSPWVADGRELPEPASVRVVWDPAAGRRSIEADRALIALYLELSAEYLRTRHGADMMRRDALAQVLRHRAAIHSDHPAYLPEWSPEPATAP